MDVDEYVGTGSRRNPITTKELDTTHGLLVNHRDAKENTTTMIPPMAECVGSIDQATGLQSTEEQPYLPVAQSVVIVNQASQTGSTATAVTAAEVQVELVPLLEAGVSNTTDDSFNTPSVQSFVTPENERANMSVLEQLQSTQNKQHPFVHCVDTPATQDLLNNQHSIPASHNRCSWFGGRGGPAQTITGEELLSRLKKHRKKATVRSGLVGGLVGFIFLGPIGALGIGAGSAAMTKHRLKRREKSLRNQLDGRLNQPLPVVSNSTGAGSSTTSRSRCHRR